MSWTVAAAVSAMAFNLVCSGNYTDWASARLRTTTSMNQVTTPFSVTYRINLDAGRWCWRECDRTYPLASVTEQKIVLQPEHSSMPGLLLHSINRESGVLVRSGDDYSFVGNCAPRKFTGFPQRRF